MLDLTSDILYKDLSDLSSLYCCFSCDVTWVDDDRCFVCSASGELLVSPIKTDESLHVAGSHGIKLSPMHKAVHPLLVEALRKKRYVSEQREHPG
jgi:hypothetical protein